jgi:cyclohexanone monooxygenase
MDRALMAASEDDKVLDLAIVGAGFGGLYSLYRALELGLEATVLEAGDSVGGVWNFNRYPGARCDTESVDYSYSFSPELEQEWHWPERYSAQPHILEYINHVADRFGLRPHIRLNTRVTTMAYDEGGNFWELESDDGEVVRARFCVMATGALSAPRLPEFEGVEDFAGETLHTAMWPRDRKVSFAGKRVGVIGTGSSGTQIVPEIAADADHLYVFQRTPNFTVPAPNGPTEPDFEAAIKATYREHRKLARETASGLYPDMSRISALEVSDAERERVLEESWRDAGFSFIQCFSDLLLDERANRKVIDFIHRKIEEQVEDPEVAELLKPKDHFFGTKRPCVASNYYPTFNRDNVSLVDVGSAPIEAITPAGLRAGGREYELDALVYATGFDALTGALSRIEIVGRGGTTLAEAWSAGPRSYLGLAVNGFPNLFILTGPGSPSVLTVVLASIEQQVEWLASLLTVAAERGVQTIEARPEAQAEWVEHVNAMAEATLYPRAESWYLGANVPGKPRVFMPYTGGLRRYRRKCDAIAADGYPGFELRAAGELAATGGSEA